MNAVPRFEINMNDPAFESFQSKKIEKIFSLSDLAICPITQGIFVLDGKRPKVVVLNKQGEIERVYLLNKKIFIQSEGITFDRNGRLFIANEWNKGGAAIIEVQLH